MAKYRKTPCIVTIVIHKKRPDHQPRSSLSKHCLSRFDDEVVLPHPFHVICVSRDILQHSCRFVRLKYSQMTAIENESKKLMKLCHF